MRFFCPGPHRYGHYYNQRYYRTEATATRNTVGFNEWGISTGAFVWRSAQIVCALGPMRRARNDMQPTAYSSVGVMSALGQKRTCACKTPDLLAGAPGFEPGNGGIKIRCLTTWLRPNRYRKATVCGGGTIPTSRDPSNAYHLYNE